MKRLLILCLLASTGLLQAAKNETLYRLNRLNEALWAASHDSVKKTERLAGLYFHELLNEYRISQKQKPLLWDDVVWLAAMNHCSWMITNRELTHTQRENTPLFSGTLPGDRVGFVTGQKTGGYGENALYNYSGHGTNVEQRARNIAQGSFAQWKSSTGHHENMLRGYGVHGIAFMFSATGVCWGVDVFSYDTKTFIGPEIIPVQAMRSTSAGNKLTRKQENTFLSELKNELVPEMEEETQQEQALSKAAAAHARYIAVIGKPSHSEKRGTHHYYGRTPYMRVLKASGWRTLFKGKPEERIFLYTLDPSGISAQEQGKQIKPDLAETAWWKARSVGLAISRKKDRLILAVVVNGYTH